MTLAEFLLARIAEDEAVAEEATQRPKNGVASREEMAFFTDGSGDVATHGLRLLAECETKRRIVEFADTVDRLASLYDELSGYPDARGDDLLRLLALPYADHPDYNEAWRP